MTTVAEQSSASRDLAAQLAERVAPWLYTLVVVAALVFGWRISEYRFVNAEEGLGYALGIIGGSMMLVLVFYPLRKRLRFMARWGSMRLWFRIHTWFGVLAPVLILYHSNFELGSTNSTIALFCMLIVAGSGVIGRYLYVRVGYGASEARARLEALRIEARRRLRTLESLLQANAELAAQLAGFAEDALQARRGALADFSYLVRLGGRTRRERRRARQLAADCIHFVAGNRGWDDAMRAGQLRQVHHDIQVYYDAAVLAGEYACYSRFFARWHQLHMPLFIMLIMTGVTHVFAVHLY